MFRTLGLRHLCVINKHNQILGIVTRSDLVSAHYLTNSTCATDHRRRDRKDKGHGLHHVDKMGPLEGGDETM